MKITKQQLKQIIKEELENVLSEDETLVQGRIRRDLKAAGEELPKGDDGEIDWKKADEMAADYRRSNPESRLATEGRFDVEAMAAKIKSTMGWKNMQPAIARQELGLEDYELDDIASKMELSGSLDVADFIRSMLSPEAER